MLCKQGVAGSIPATSTKPFHIELLREVSLGSYSGLCMNCAKKNRIEPLCTIREERKSPKLGNELGQLDAQEGSVPA